MLELIYNVFHDGEIMIKVRDKMKRIDPELHISIYAVVKNLWKKHNVVGRDVLEGRDNYAVRKICKYAANCS